MKKSKKVFLGILSALLVIVLVLGAVELWYYPHYRKHMTAVEVNDVSDDGEVRVMSSNLRCISPTDLGRKSWFYRADLIIKNVEMCSPDIIGFQEATKYHYAYLCSSLPQYDSVITYRDEASLSEGCPVFYRRDKYELADKGSFWLSETPETMSKDWGAACYRICSYVILTDKASGVKFVVFNTHLDHVSDEARIKGIAVVLDKIKQFGSLPAMIMGDFNCVEDSETYRSATENFLDVKYQTENSVGGCTYQDFGRQLDRKPIDYVMISKTGFKVNSYRVVDTVYGGAYPSDHYPLLVSLSFDR